MTASYVAEHDSALADILAAGTAVTFSRVSDTAYNQATDVATTATTTIGGAAIQVKGTGEMFRALTLVHTTVLALLFAPTTYGDRVLSGDTVVWSGVAMTVKDAAHVALSGSVILSRVTVVV